MESGFEVLRPRKSTENSNRQNYRLNQNVLSGHHSGVSVFLLANGHWIQRKKHVSVISVDTQKQQEWASKIFSTITSSLTRDVMGSSDY